MTLYLSKNLRKRNDNDALTKTEVARLIQEIAEPRDHLMILIGVESGGRVGELASLLIEKVSLTKNTITVWDDKKHEYAPGKWDARTRRYNRGKSIAHGRWRTIKLPKYVMAELKLHIDSLPKGQVKVWDSNPKTFERAIQKWTLKVLNNKKSWHCLRHTFMTLSRQAGKSMEYVIKQTGDTPETILKVYSKITPDQLEKEAEVPII